MGHGVVRIDLPETREPLPDLLVRQDADAERRLAFDTLVECDLGTGQQADGNVRLPDRRESASNRIVEFRRHQLVLDLGRPVRDVVQTIVTHRRAPLPVKSRDFPGPPNLIGSKLALFRLPWKKKAYPIVTRPSQSVWNRRHWHSTPPLLRANAFPERVSPISGGSHRSHGLPTPVVPGSYITAA